jgi:hypothetical protein
MVGVAQLVERWIVAPVAVGSIPIAHPLKDELKRKVHRRDCRDRIDLWLILPVLHCIDRGLYQ